MKLTYHKTTSFNRLICRIFGHRINDTHAHLWCGRCELAYEEIYNGLKFHEAMRKIYGNQFAKFTYQRLGWSLLTFGYDLATEKILNHIIEEVEEARKNPTDLFEWVDIIFLALDGAGRMGNSGETILEAMHEKHDMNRARKWEKGEGDVPHHHIEKSPEQESIICPQCDPKVEGVCPDTNCERFTGEKFNRGER